MCGDSGCRLHSRAPVFPPQPSLGQQVTCHQGGEGREGGEAVQGAREGLTLVPGEGGEVVVVDSVGLSSLSSPTAPPCDVSSLLSALTYWCQGKPGGCSLPPASLSSLTNCRGEELSQLRVDWHSEPDYGSTEIPCPSYNSGPLSKKFSK